MKVLFLDIDGVLNSHAFYKRRHESGKRNADTEADWRAGQICAEQVALLNEILQRSGAVCVLSSTWRIEPPIGLAKTLEALRAHGFTGEIIDVTPNCAQYTEGGIYLGHERGFEIAEWLSKHPEVTTFAIVDDGSDMAHLKHRLVQTTWQSGLERTHVERLVYLLTESERGAVKLLVGDP